MSRVYSRSLSALLLVFAAVFGGMVAAPQAQADGRTNTNACATDLRREFPDLSTDVRTEEQPAVLVHGLWSDRASLVGVAESLKTIKRLVAYRFDYKLANDDWVTDGDTAQRLAKTIVCLSRLYGGKDVVVVAHSMDC